MSNIWIFSNKYKGRYGDTDWDTSTILKTKRYYFKENEPNRWKVKKLDQIILREYGSGFWGTCEIVDEWAPDSEALSKHNTKAGWFPIDKIKKWKATLPYEVICPELSNKNFRLRIAKATEEDKKKIELSLKIYRNLGFGSVDGNFFLLEAGIEEAVKANLSQLKLKLAGKNIQQQCSLEIGVGRTDLICVNGDGNYVVLELKAGRSSDDVVGQILRYIGYIRENWAEKDGKKVLGIILTPEFDEHLRLAAKAAGIKVLRLRIY